MFGNSPLEIDGNDDIHIKVIRYKGTPGAYEIHEKIRQIRVL